MFDKHIDTAHPSDRAHEHASFRARLLAREARRPQSTLAIDSGVYFRPGGTDSVPARRAAEAARTEARRREAEATPAPVAAPVVAPAAAKAEPAAPPPPSDAELVSVIEEVAARREEDLAREEDARRAPPPAAVVIPSVEARRETAVRMPEPAVAEAHEHTDISTRIGDMSQIAFAGLAVLGLAGLSVMAAENALEGPKKPAGADTETNTGALAPALKPGGASAVALAAAAPAEPKAWFNYQGVADMLAERKAAMDEAARAAQEEADREARLQAASAIAEAEAARVAEEEQAALDAAAEARLAEEAERQRLAEAEAARVAEAEAARQARLEAERKAAAEAEAQRLADLEAKKVAEAEAEAQRVADLEAQRLAKLEAERKAAAEAARKEAFEQAKAEEAERLRLAALKTQAEADAAEARRLEQAAAKAKADRLAAEKLAAERLAAQKTAEKKAAEKAAAAAAAPKPQPIVFTPYEGPVPVPASYKPAKPKIMAKASVREPTVSRQAPAVLRADTASVRSFDAASPQTPEAFLASRIERTSSAPITTEDREMIQQAFRSILDNGADGSKQSIVTPDGRQVSLVLERTVSREMGQSTVRTVTYTPGVNAVTRVVTEQAPVTVSVMCRDVAYAFAGQEHGRFAACQAPNGGWTLARATDVVKVTTASLPNSAG